MMKFNSQAICSAVKISGIFVLMFLISPCIAQSRKPKKFLVCGDSKVVLVDYDKSADSIPEIVWSWDAHLADDLPQVYRTKMFNTIDDCKPINNGKQILLSSSSGAVAIVNMKDHKVVFYASVPNAHSIAILPGDLIAAASSTGSNGNKLMLFDMHKPEKPIYTDSLHSAHGVVWVEKRKSLFALGYDVLREYTLVSKGGLQLKGNWKIPGIDGHELMLAPGGANLFMTEHGGSWSFDLNTAQFSKISDFADTGNIKSLSRDDSGQYIFTIPEKSWWTYHVKFLNPERRFAFPGMQVYKARWFSN